MTEWRTQTSQSLQFCSDGPGREIYQMFHLPDVALMHDSVLPSQDRYDRPRNPHQPQVNRET